MEWKSYTDNRLIALHDAGFFVIKPVETTDAVRPLFSYDEDIFDKYVCCDNCANTWVYNDVDSWNDGWRPTSEEVIDKCNDRA
jgi:hypothetical protein